MNFRKPDLWLIWFSLKNKFLFTGLKITYHICWPFERKIQFPDKLRLSFFAPIFSIVISHANFAFLQFVLYSCWGSLSLSMSQFLLSHICVVLPGWQMFHLYSAEKKKCQQLFHERLNYRRFPCKIFPQLWKIFLFLNRVQFLLNPWPSWA